MIRFILLAFLVTASIEGLLPPAWQNVAELKEILNSEELPNYLQSADVIESITRTDGGWLIQTNHGNIRVDVVSERTPYIGPRKFSLQFKKD